MDQFISGLTEKAGIDEATAQKVVAFIKENWSQIPQWLGSSGLTDRLPDGIEDKVEGLLGIGGQSESAQ